MAADFKKSFQNAIEQDFESYAGMNLCNWSCKGIARISMLCSHTIAQRAYINTPNF